MAAASLRATSLRMRCACGVGKIEERGPPASRAVEVEAVNAAPAERYERLLACVKVSDSETG